MTTDVSAALATLQLHPDDSQALKALAAVHPGNGAGIDADVLSKALSDARRFHRERGDYELVVSLIDLELAWTTEAARRADLLHEKGRVLFDELLRDEAGQAAVREALDASPGHAAVDRVAGADVAGARQLGADLEALPAAGRGREGPGAGVQPLRIGRRVPPQVPPGGRRGRDATCAAAWSWTRTTAARATTSSALLREKGSNDELLTLYIAARRPRRQPRRAGAGRGRGRRAVRQDEPPGRRLHALPQGAGREPERAARAARRARRALAASRSGRSWARCWRRRRAASAASRTSRC